MPPEQRRRLWQLLLLIVVGAILIIGGGRTALSAPGLNVIIPLILVGALVGLIANSRRR